MKKLTIVLGILLTFGLLFSSCSNGSKDDSGSSGNNTNNNSGNNNNTGNNNTGNNNGNTDWSWLIGTWRLTDASGESEITENGTKLTVPVSINDLEQAGSLNSLGYSFTVTDSNLSQYSDSLSKTDGRVYSYNAELLAAMNAQLSGMTITEFSTSGVFTLSSNKLSFNIVSVTNQSSLVTRGTHQTTQDIKSTYNYTYTKQ